MNQLLLCLVPLAPVVAIGVLRAHRQYRERELDRYCQRVGVRRRLNESDFALRKRATQVALDEQLRGGS